MTDTVIVDEIDICTCSAVTTRCTSITKRIGIAVIAAVIRATVQAGSVDCVETEGCKAAGARVRRRGRKCQGSRYEIERERKQENRGR